jgi:hypothetical protein
MSDWAQDFKWWRKWDVVVYHEGAAAEAAVEALNRGLPAGAAGDLLLAFPAFHLDDDSGQVSARGQPLGDPFVLAKDFEHLLALSEGQPRWRFQVVVEGEDVFTVRGGKVSDRKAAKAVKAFLEGARAAEAKPAKAFGGRIEITLELEPANRRKVAPHRAALAERWLSLAGGSIGVGEDRFVPLVTDLKVDVDGSPMRVAGKLASGTQGRAVHALVGAVAEALLGSLMERGVDMLAPVESRVLLDGEEAGQAGDLLELRALAPMLAHGLDD